MSQESNRQKFEDWYSSTKLDKISTWHEDEQRYTVFSMKQYCWQAWNASLEKIAEELSFLRYFYGRARHAMGPADSEIYDMIKEDYRSAGYELPKGYELSYEVEDDY